MSWRADCVSHVRLSCHPGPRSPVSRGLVQRVSVLRKNIAFLFVSQIATWMISIVILIMEPRRLGAEGFGTVQFVMSYLGFFVLVGGLGTYAHMVKSIAKDPSVLSATVVSALRFKLVLGLVLSVSALAIGAALGYTAEVLTMIAVGCVGLVLSLLTEMVIGGLAGLERIAHTAVWTTVQVYVASIGTIVVLLTSRSLVALVAVSSFAWLVPLIANFRHLRPLLSGFRTRHPGAWVALIRGGVPVFMLTALSLVYQTIDVPILEGISGAEAVGWYTLALRWIGMPIFITTIVVTAFLPQMSALAHREPEAFAGLTNRALSFVLVVNIPAALGLFMVAPDLIDLLYGTAFEESIPLMRLLVPWVPLAAINTVLATALIAADRHKRFIWVAAAAAVFNPLLAARAIRYTQDRYDNGAVGAAVVTVVTEVFIAFCAVVMRPPGILDRSTLGYIGRCLLAAVAMVPPILLVGDGGIVVKVVVGAIVYALTSLALRTVSTAELHNLLDKVRRRGGGSQQDDNTSSDTVSTDTPVDAELDTMTERGGER